MIGVDEALQQVLLHTTVLGDEQVSLADCVGRHLAHDVLSDMDSPPHDKSMVDGYAVQATDLREDRAELKILEEVTAGAVPTHEVLPGSTTRIMTGAPIPPGADAVVMIERGVMDPARPNHVQLQDHVVRGQHIMPQATVMRTGETVLTAGTRIRPSEVGLLAEVGAADVPVTRVPQVAILSTGNELVPPDVKPGPGMIRNSNGPMLHALATQAAAVPLPLGVAADTPDALEHAVQQGLAADILLLSGGVSAGVLDLVPATLTKLGVQQVFHKVQLKPGKPLWFGVTTETPSPTLVFGLPGNPVSGLVCFELFVRPALQKLQGAPSPQLKTSTAQLLASQQVKGGRETYLPGNMRIQDDQPRVTPVPWQGSADQRAFSHANCLIRFAPRDTRYEQGELVPVVPLFQDP